jgi:replication-associated recombination protein RarA
MNIYQPKSLAEMILDTATRKKIDFILHKKIGLHIFHSSQTGSGKTTTAKLIASKLSSFPFIIDCSLKSDVKKLDQLESYLSSYSLDSMPRVVLIDELDKLTERKTEFLIGIENKFAGKALILVTSNQINKLPPSLISRAGFIDFSEMNIDEQVKDYLTKVYLVEKETITDEDMNFIKKLTNMFNKTRDLRKTLSMLEEYIFTNDSTVNLQITGGY